mmetsp:Transcript_173039/g.554878  ORF Transcript_173039/g.554878 Transcript_173039/m.554878 type:complete len:526 (-) Transcript_173039:16-1593(-)
MLQPAGVGARFWQGQQWQSWKHVGRRRAPIACQFRQALRDVTALAVAIAVLFVVVLPDTLPGAALAPPAPAHRPEAPPQSKTSTTSQASATVVASKRRTKVDEASFDFFASCIGGLEVVLESELRDLGVKRVRRISRGVFFSGSARSGCRALIALRTATSVDEILGVIERPLADRDDMVSFVQRVCPWDRTISNSETLLVECKGSPNHLPAGLRQTQLTAMSTQKAITDVCLEKTGARPNIEFQEPDWMLRMVFHRDGAQLSRRWTGRQGGHRRGYREDVVMHKAALRETTAAGVLLLAGLRAGENISFLDPMCGSGTLALEAAMIAANIPPGLLRAALSKSQTQAVPIQWRGLLQEELAAARSEVHVPRGLDIRGSDANPSALSLARRCLAAIEGVVPEIRGKVTLEARSAGDATPPSRRTRVRRLICCNPPWGVRLGKGEADPEDEDADSGPPAEESWRELADLLRRHKGDAWVLTPNPDLAKGLPLQQKAVHKVDGGPRDAPSKGAFGLQWIGYGSPTPRGV